MAVRTRTRRGAGVAMFEVSKKLFANEMQMKCHSPPAPFPPRHSLAMRRRRRRGRGGGGGCGGVRIGRGVVGEEEESVAGWVVRRRMVWRRGWQGGGECCGVGGEEEDGVAAWMARRTRAWRGGGGCDGAGDEEEEDVTA